MAGYKTCRAKVIGTTSSKKNVSVVNELGYDVAINIMMKGWYERLEAAAQIA